MVTSTKLSELKELKEKLLRLESDPELQNDLKLRSDILEMAAANGVDHVDELITLLIPHLSGGKSSLEVNGIYAKPVNDKKRLLHYAELKKLEQRVQKQLALMEEDPLIQRRNTIVEKVTNAGLSLEKAVLLLDPSRKVTRPPKQNKGHATKGAKAPAGEMMYWWNPHTGETCAGRKRNLSALKRWSLEYGERIYEDWKISEKAYQKAQNP